MPSANNIGLLAVLPEAVTGDAVPCADGSAVLAPRLASWALNTIA